MRRHHTVVARGAPKRTAVRPTPADPNGGTRSLRRSREKTVGINLRARSVVTDRLSAPEITDDFKCLVQTFRAFNIIGATTERREFFRHRSQAGSDDNTSAAKEIDRGDLLRERRRVSARQCRDEYPQPNPRRHRRDRGHDRPRVHGRSVGGTVGEVIPDEEPVPPRALGGLGDVDEELRISEAGNIRYSDTKSHSTSTRTSARAKADDAARRVRPITPRGFGEAARLSTMSLRYRCRILCRRERDDRGAPLHVQAARKNSPGAGTRGVRASPSDTALRAQGQAGATCTSNLVGAGRPGRQRCRQAVRVLWGHVDVLGGVPRRSCGVPLRPRGGHLAST